MLGVQLFALNPPTATVLGALVGATTAILAVAITSWRLLRLERIRIEENRIEENRIEENRIEENRIEENRELERSRLDASREDVVSTELADAVQQLAIKCRLLCTQCAGSRGLLALLLTR